MVKGFEHIAGLDDVAKQVADSVKSDDKKRIEVETKLNNLLEANDIAGFKKTLQKWYDSNEKKDNHPITLGGTLEHPLVIKGADFSGQKFIQVHWNNVEFEQVNFGSDKNNNGVKFIRSSLKNFVANGELEGMAIIRSDIDNATFAGKHKKFQVTESTIHNLFVTGTLAPAADEQRNGNVVIFDNPKLDGLIIALKTPPSQDMAAGIVRVKNNPIYGKQPEITFGEKQVVVLESHIIEATKDKPAEKIYTATVTGGVQVKATSITDAGNKRPEAKEGLKSEFSKDAAENRLVYDHYTPPKDTGKNVLGKLNIGNEYGSCSKARGCER